MLLLQVEHLQEVIINAFSALAHAVNVKEYGANGFCRCVKFFNTFLFVSTQGLERHLKLPPCHEVSVGLFEDRS